jgi:hypothetical protein
MQSVDVDRDRCLRDGNYSPFSVSAASGNNRINLEIRNRANSCFGETSDCAYAISDVVLPADRHGLLQSSNIFYISAVISQLLISHLSCSISAAFISAALLLSKLLGFYLSCFAFYLSCFFISARISYLKLFYRSCLILAALSQLFHILLPLKNHVITRN